MSTPARAQHATEETAQQFANNWDVILCPVMRNLKLHASFDFKRCAAVQYFLLVHTMVLSSSDFTLHFALSKKYFSKQTKQDPIQWWYRKTKVRTRQRRSGRSISCNWITVPRAEAGTRVEAGLDNLQEPASLIRSPQEPGRKNVTISPQPQCSNLGFRTF